MSEQTARHLNRRIDTASLVTTLATTNIPQLWRGPSVAPSLADLKRFRDQPHSFLLELALEHGETVWYGAGPLKFVLGVSPEHVQHVLVAGQKVYTKSTFQYGFLSDVTGDGLLTSDGQKWRVRRRIQQPAFQRKRLELVCDSTRRNTAALLARWEREGTGRVDVADEMFQLSLDVVMDVLFGYHIGRRAPEIVGATLGVLHYLVRRSRSIPGVPAWIAPRRLAEFKRCLGTLDRIVAEILAHRRMNGPRNPDLPTLLDLLVEAEGESRITPEGVRNEMMTMIIAGHETVASALTWAWRLVGDAPDVAEELARESAGAPRDAAGIEVVKHLRVARNVMSEAMRLYPPAWIVTRRSEPIQIERNSDHSNENENGNGNGNGKNNDNDDGNDDGDVSEPLLPVGTLVMLSPYVTHRLPRYWPDPDRFDPSRFDRAITPGTWFPFGAGQRLCIGRDFALVESALALSDIAGRYRLIPVEPVSREYAGVTLQPEGGLMVEVSSRR